MATLTQDPTAPSMPLLLRLYPAPWRERYGDEFAELLSARPPGPRDRLDIIRGAVDARLHPQVAATPLPRVASTRDRILALAAVTSGALFSAWAAVLVAFMPRWSEFDGATVDSALIGLSYAAGLFGAMIAMVVLFGVAFRHVEDLGSVGAIGAVIAATGFMLFAWESGAWAVILLNVGTLVMSPGLARAVGWPVALLMVTATVTVGAAMFGFIGGDGQELLWMWMLLVYGPAWILLGIKLRNGIRVPAWTPARA